MATITKVDVKSISVKDLLKKNKQASVVAQPVPVKLEVPQNDKEVNLYSYHMFQDVNEVVKSLQERRPLEKDLGFEVETLMGAVDEVEKNREVALKEVQSMSVPEEVKSEISKGINDRFDSLPTKTMHFVGFEDEDYISHMVLRDSDTDPGKIIPLSQLAKEETLYKFFQVNQSTMEKLGNGYRQALYLNYLINHGELSANKGRKKARLNPLGELRALVTVQYKTLDNLEVIEKVREVIPMDDTTSHQFMLDERKMVGKFLYKNGLTIKYKGDVASGGLAFLNSEVGLSSVQAYVLLNVNGTDFLIKPGNSAYKYREVHKGYDTAESLESFGQHLEFAQGYIVEVLNKYKTLHGIKVPNAKKTMETLANKFQQTRGKKAMAALVEEAEKLATLTFRDVVHIFANFGITQKHQHINFRHDMQTIAGTLINMTEEEILEVL